jgi:hypothetical protein
MRALRRTVRKSDIFWWIDSFLSAVFAHDLNAFPPLEDYIPAQNFARMHSQIGCPAWMGQTG